MEYDDERHAHCHSHHHFHGEGPLLPFSEGEQHIGIKLKTISRMMGRQVSNSITALDLTSAQGFMLIYLTHYDGAASQRELEERFHLAHPTVSRILQRMEAKGFIECTTSEDDRRRKCVVATDKARQIEQQITHQMRVVEESMISGFTTEEVDMFHSFLDRILANITLSTEEGGTTP